MARFFIFLLCFFASSASAVEAYRSAILHFTADPQTTEQCYEYYDDGLLIIERGKVAAVGPAYKLVSTLPKGTEIECYADALIIPGMIDTHIHFPQTDMIASYGEQLLEWLQKYTFPHEQRFEDKHYAEKISKIFIQELLRNGTTSALVFCAGSTYSVDALFKEASHHNMRLIAGKAVGDRNLPDHLLQPTDKTYDENKKLIKKWHQKKRLLYAVTPRFAPTCSEKQLQAVGKLLKEHPDVYLHTHLSENVEEVQWVKQLFPWSHDYLSVYERYGFLRPRAVFAHSIHISDEEIHKLAKSKSAVSFCPTSNLFLGSGLFNWEKCRKAGVLIGIGTDVGAGTSFSMLHTLGDGYKVAQMQKQKLSPFEAFYHATLGGAKALYIEDHVGNFLPGKEADFVILDLASTPLMRFRMEDSPELADKLFLLMILGDDRNVKETYVAGKRSFRKESSKKD